MALFGHKKKTEETKAAPTAAVNPDDIWNTAVPKKSSATEDKDEAQTVVIKESKYDEPAPETVGPASIDPETIRKKMELLEKEFEERQSRPVLTHADFETNPVAQDEVAVSQEKFEKEYAIEHQRYLDTHVQDIAAANSEDIDRKISEMLDETARRAQAVEEKHYGIEQVGQDEVEKGLAQLHDPKDVTKDKDYKNIEAVTDEAMSGAEEYIRTQLDTREVVEEDDEIESVSPEYVEKKTQEFMEIYGDR